MRTWTGTPSLKWWAAGWLRNGDNTRDLSARLRKARKVWYILCKQLPGLRLKSQLVHQFVAVHGHVRCMGVKCSFFQPSNLKCFAGLSGGCLRGLLNVEIEKMKGEQTMTGAGGSDSPTSAAMAGQSDSQGAHSINMVALTLST